MEPVVALRGTGQSLQPRGPARRRAAAAPSGRGDGNKSFASARRSRRLFVEVCAATTPPPRRGVLVWAASASLAEWYRRQLRSSCLRSAEWHADRHAVRRCPKAPLCRSFPSRYRDASHEVREVLNVMLPWWQDGIGRRLSRFQRHRPIHPVSLLKLATDIPTTCTPAPGSMFDRIGSNRMIAKIASDYATARCCEVRGCERGFMAGLSSGTAGNRTKKAERLASQD